MFTPEFRNRLDAVIQFAPLDSDHDRARGRQADRRGGGAARAEGRARSPLDDAARRWIAEKGYDPKMGARPMARLIQEHIKRPLAEELLFGRLAGGGHGARSSVSEDGSRLKLDMRAERRCPR